jgi:succinyl-diaminopimelate desuccinylase
MMIMSEKLIRKEIEENKTVYIEFLRRLIKAESYNPPGNEKNVALIIEDHLKKSNIQLELFPFGDNRANLIIYLKNNFQNKNLLYNAHMDVVPPGNENDWKYPPLSASMKRNKLIFGRGSSDMKAALAAMVISLTILKKLNLNLSGNLIVNAVADEETGGIYGTKWCLENILQPRNIKCDFIIVGEPSGLAPLPKAIILGEKGHLLIKIITHGKSAHSMVPDMGINAIYMMSKIIANLESLDNFIPKIEPPFSLEELKSLVSSAFPNYEIFDKIFNEQPLLKHFLISLTNFTKSLNIINGGIKGNIIPDHCEAIMDFRLLPGQNSKIIIEGLKKLITHIGLTVMDDSTEEKPESFVSLEIYEEGSASIWKDYEKSDAIKEFKIVVEKVYGKKSFFSLAPGSSDAHYYRNNGYCIKTIHFGPGKAADMHAIDESIEIEDFINSILVYTLFAYEFLK